MSSLSHVFTDSLAKLMNECVAVDGYVSPYVLAFTQTQPTLRGCESASRAGPAQSRFPREVHVLNVLHDVERVDGSPPHVTVRLEPSSPTGKLNNLIHVEICRNIKRYMIIDSEITCYRNK